MPKISILWGEVPETGDSAKTYEFATQAELDAFKLGVEEACGWMNWAEAPEGYVVPEGGVDIDDLNACMSGIHSWADTPGKLPPDTKCTCCGETYGEPD